MPPWRPSHHLCQMALNLGLGAVYHEKDLAHLGAFFDFSTPLSELYMGNAIPHQPRGSSWMGGFG